MFFTFNFSSLSISFSKYPKAEGSPLKFFFKKRQFPDLFSPAGYALHGKNLLFFAAAVKQRNFTAANEKSHERYGHSVHGLLYNKKLSYS